MSYYEEELGRRAVAKLQPAQSAKPGEHGSNPPTASLEAKIAEFVTAVDVRTPERAMQMAVAAIDQGAFWRQPVDS